MENNLKGQLFSRNDYFCIVKYQNTELEFKIDKHQNSEYLFLKIFAEINYKNFKNFLNDFNLFYHQKNLLSEYTLNRKLFEYFDQSETLQLFLEKKDIENENKKQIVLVNLKSNLEKIQSFAGILNKENFQELIKLNFENPIFSLMRLNESLQSLLEERLFFHFENFNLLKNFYEEYIEKGEEDLNIENIFETFSDKKYIDFYEVVNFFKTIKKDFEAIFCKIQGNNLNPQS